MIGWQEKIYDIIVNLAKDVEQLPFFENNNGQ